MKKFLFELITSPVSLFENHIYDYIVMAIIGYIAYKVAFGAVGDLGLRGFLIILFLLLIYML